MWSHLKNWKVSMDEGLTSVNLELLLLFPPNHILGSRKIINSRLTQNSSQNLFAYYLTFYCNVEKEQTCLPFLCARELSSEKFSTNLEI